MELEKFIICETAPGKTFAYQVYERQGDWTITYYAPTNRLENPLSTLTVARNLLHRLQADYDREVSSEGGLRS